MNKCKTCAEKFNNELLYNKILNYIDFKISDQYNNRTAIDVSCIMVLKDIKNFIIKNKRRNV